MTAAPRSVVAPPIPERHYRAAELMSCLGWPRRLAILEAVAERGPMNLATATMDAGVSSAGALRDAADMELAGFVTVERPSGRNLSSIITITPAGRRALELAAMWAEL